MLTRRRLLLSAAGLAALGALPACGSDPASGVQPAARDDGFPVTVEHELGETRLESAPQRVVCATDGGELCSLLALGVTPVGFGQRNDPLRPWVRELAEGIDSYDLSGGETSYERLAAWAPDLLLAQSGFATDETLPRFTEIAPTVATSFIDWRDNLRQVATAVGRTDRADELEQEADAAVADAAAALPERATGLRLRAITAFSDGSVYQLNDASPLGKIAAAMGLPPLPAAQAAGQAVDVLSLEQLTVLDGDLLLLLVFGGDGDGTAALRERSVFSALDVVRAGRVVEVSEDDAHALYFDSVLTVEPNAQYLLRTLTAAA